MRYFSYIILTIFFTGAVCCKKDKRSASKAPSTEEPKAAVQSKKSTAQLFKHIKEAKLAVGEEVEVFEDGCKVNYSTIITKSLDNIPPNFQPHQKKIIQGICSNANRHIKCTQLTAQFALDGKMNGEEDAVSVTVNVGCMETQDDRYQVKLGNSIHIYLLLIVILLALIICFFIHSCLKKNKMPFLPQPIGVESHQQLGIRPSNASVITIDRSTSYDTTSNTAVRYSTIGTGHRRKVSVNKSTSTEPSSRKTQHSLSIKSTATQSAHRKSSINKSTATEEGIEEGVEEGVRYQRSDSVDKGTSTEDESSKDSLKSTAMQSAHRKSSINKSTATEEGIEEGVEKGVEEGVRYQRSDSVDKATSTKDESSKDSLKVEKLEAQT